MKSIQIIIQNTKSMKESRQCVHDNLQSSFIFTISVGSVPVSWLYDRDRYPLKWESHKTCEWWEIWMTTQCWKEINNNRYKLELAKFFSIPKVVGILTLRNSADNSNHVNRFSSPISSGSDPVRWLLTAILFWGEHKYIEVSYSFS